MNAVLIERVDAEALRQQFEAFKALLDDAVSGGASVGFVHPFDDMQCAAFWREVGDDLARGARRLLAARIGARIVGTVQLVPSSKPNQAHRADVSKLLVHRSARRRGVASALMRAVEAMALAEGRSLLVLDTRTESDAERLYRRLGWIDVGTIPDYAADPDGTLAACTFFYKRLASAAADGKR